LVRFGLVQARAALEGGHPTDAIAVIGKLQDRGVRHPDLAPLESAAQDWAHAAELADRGEFLRAVAELDKLRPKLPGPSAAFEQFRAAVEARHGKFREAVTRLLDAAEARLWRGAPGAAAGGLAGGPGPPPGPGVPRHAC